ncbi:condensation domain-containing protein [Streptomyces diastatochromogenes]|nr:condensation domain-containing protein [Streptomyces diastatochromogenes]
MGCTGVTAVQEAMWLQQELAPDRPNNVVTLWDVDGDLDIPLLTEALRTAVSEAGALTVNFRRGEGGLRMVARDPERPEPFHLDVGDADDPGDAARAVVAELVSRPFDLGEDALFRIGSIRLGATRHLVVLVFHHIVTDAFGVVTLLSQRVAEIYRALRTGSAVPELPANARGDAQQKDAAYRASERFAQAEEFWRDYLADEPTAARLPAGVRPAAEGRPAGHWDGLTEPLGMTTRTARIPAAELAVWRRTADAVGTSLPDLLAAAATAFLRHMCAVPEPLHEFTVNHRVGPLRRSLGLLSNRLPIRAEVPPAATLVELAEALGRSDGACCGTRATTCP